MSTAETQPEHEALVFQVGSWPEFPPGVLPHDSVDLDADDPALLQDGKRQCVGVKAGGGRCGAPATSTRLLCSMHAGLADPALAAHAKHRKDAERRERAEEELGRRSLGTRATIAQVLHEEHAKLEATVKDLLTRAATGDTKAQALLPAYLNQALGQPQERVEHTLPQTAEDVRQADTATLVDLVAEGRKRRLAQQG